MEGYKSAPRSDTVRLLPTVRANSFGAAYLPFNIVGVILTAAISLFGDLGNPRMGTRLI